MFRSRSGFRQDDPLGMKSHNARPRAALVDLNIQTGEISVGAENKAGPRPETTKNKKKSEKKKPPHFAEQKALQEGDDLGGILEVGDIINVDRQGPATSGSGLAITGLQCYQVDAKKRMARQAKDFLKTSINGSEKSCDNEPQTDDVELLGSLGTNALEEWPHERAICNLFPFSEKTAEARCDQCHCYVCGVPVWACDRWERQHDQDDQAHCLASGQFEKWRDEKKRVQNQLG